MEHVHFSLYTDNHSHRLCSHPKRERDREAHLNYYTSAYNKGDNYYAARQNKIKYDTNKHASLTKNQYNIKSTQKN